MNTAQIAYALEQDPKTSKMFCGMFPSDKLPQRIEKYPCGLVANTDPSTRPGEDNVVMSMSTLFFRNSSNITSISDKTKQ